MTTKLTTESVQCFPVDMEMLNNMVNKYFHDKHKTPENMTYSIIGSFALIRNPILAIINEEFIGGEISKEVTWNIFEETLLANGHRTFTCLPTNEITVSLPELEEFLGEPVSLAEFTKERRGYNSRIQNNEREWLRAFNK